jgi:hypothetical protein
MDTVVHPTEHERRPVKLDRPAFRLRKVRMKNSAEALSHTPRRNHLITRSCEALSVCHCQPFADRRVAME